MPLLVRVSPARKLIVLASARVQDGEGVQRVVRGGLDLGAGGGGKQGEAEQRDADGPAGSGHVLFRLQNA